jgi:hypothetical protein
MKLMKLMPELMKRTAAMKPLAGGLPAVVRDMACLLQAQAQ